VWEDVDISADTGADTAIGAIFIIQNSSSLPGGTGTAHRHVGLRKKGSTDDRWKDLRSTNATAGIIGVDGSEVCQFFVQTDVNDAKPYLVGYVTSGAVFFTNAADKSTATTGSYVDVDITGDIGADNANGALVELIPTVDSSFGQAAFRRKGATYDHYYTLTHSWLPVEIDANDVFQQKVWSTEYDLFLVGYTLESAAPPSLSVNYRSIGTQVGTLYSTGDASITSDTSVVTFAGGASLPTTIGQGDKLVIGADTFYILSRDSATQVTIQETASSTHTSQAYTISRAYNDFQSWETARDGDLVAENRREVGVAYNDGTFSPTAGIVINGSTTDSTHYMTITVADGQRHTGVAGTGVVVDAISVTGDIFALEDEYTVIEWLELRNFDGGVNTDGFVVDDVNPGTGSLLQNLIIHDFDAAENAIRIQSDATVRNVIIYDGDDGIDLEQGAALTIENVTIYGMVDDGFNADATAGALTARNVISVGSGGEDFEISGPITYFGYNMYDPNAVLGFNPASYQGNNLTPPASLDDLFVSIAAGFEDLHLEGSGHNAIDTGVNLAGSVDDDIDGDSRPIGSGWEIGADERAAVATLTINYRSIGTQAGTLYSTGNASISSGTSIVTFGGATLPANIGQGDKLVIGADTFYILSRDSATQVTIQETASSTHTNEAYTISRAYNTFTAWEAARQGDLVAEDRREVGVAYDDGDFTDGNQSWPFFLYNRFHAIHEAHRCRRAAPRGRRRRGGSPHGWW
jgi:hypothetical protein